MRADRVVVATPALDDDLGFPQGVEDLAVEQFVTQARVEAFDVAVLPWTAWRDVCGPGADRGDPLLHGLGHELRTVVGSDVAWHAAQDEQVCEEPRSHRWL